jgi:hypothetical protein
MPPARIRLSRRRGWRLPPGAVSVARPGRFGNPFSLTRQFARTDPLRPCLQTAVLEVTGVDAGHGPAAAARPRPRVLVERLAPGGLDVCAPVSCSRWRTGTWRNDRRQDDLAHAEGPGGVDGA